jgi:hypothetical protein
VISQRGKIPPEEGPSHFGSWAAAARGDLAGGAPPTNSHLEGSKSAVRSITQSLPRRHCHPGNRPRRSRAQTCRAKATDGTETLDAQCPGTSRRRGRGMWTGLVREVERPSRARSRSSRTGNGDRISTTRSRGSARRASDGVVVLRKAVQDNTAGGKDPCFVYVSGAGKRG